MLELRIKKNSKLTKIGYIWGNRGRLFLFQEQLSEISQNGMRRFFRDNNTKDITIAYDDFNERVIVASPNYTVSYRNNVFVSFHDYKADRVFSVGNRLYSVIDNTIWKHDNELFTVFYNKEFPCFIDIVFNQMINKNLSSISWITNSQNPNGEFDYDDTFDLAHIITENQSSGTIKIENYKNTRNSQGIWTLNDFRDISRSQGRLMSGVENDFNLIQSSVDYNKAWFEKKRFNVNDWVIVRLMYNKNTNSLIIKNIQPNLRTSAR